MALGIKNTPKKQSGIVHYCNGVQINQSGIVHYLQQWRVFINVYQEMLMGITYCEFSEIVKYAY